MRMSIFKRSRSRAVKLLTEAQQSTLIGQASDLRDQLLMSVAKLESYSEALSVEVERIKREESKGGTK